MGRNPQCSSMDCALCGFGKEGGIPTCKALETSEQLIKWTRYDDLERPGKKSLQNQLLEKEGKLCDLWADFKKHSKLYMAHHTKAKWPTNSRGLCLSTFQDGDIVIETDFMEKYSHVPGAVVTCAHHPLCASPPNHSHGGYRALQSAAVGGRRKGSPDRDMDFCFR